MKEHLVHTDAPLTGVLRAAAHTLPAVALAKCSSRLSDPLKCSSRLLSASHGQAVRIVDASRPKVVVLGNRWRCHMAGKLLVTRGLGPEAVEYSKRFQQSAELPLGSDSYLAIATGTVQHGDFRCRSSTVQVIRSHMRRSRSACKCTEQRNRTRANRRRSIRRGRGQFCAGLRSEPV